MSNLSTAISKSLSLFKKEIPMKGSDWANKYFHLSSEGSYSSGAWVGYPPQDILIDLICDDGVEAINLIKSARCGYSKMLLISLGYFQAHKKRNTAIWQATDSAAVDFVKTQVNPMLRDVAAVREVFKNSYGRKCAENTNNMKIFDNRTVLHILGAVSAKNFRAISVDNAFLDELSSYEPTIDNEGSPVLLAKKRTSGSIFPKIVCGSTPKMAGSCLIHAEFEKSQLKMRFHVPCPNCQTMHPLTWGGMKWEKDKPETVLHHCPHCNTGYTQNEFLDVWHNIRLQDDSGNYYFDGEFYNSDNEIIETPRSVGVHIWAAYIPQQTWATLVQEWLDCYKDPVTLRTFINTTLGEVDNDGVESVPPTELQKRAEDFYKIPNEAVCLAVGVDIQQDRIEFEMVAWNEKEESWSMEYQILYGDILQDGVWQELSSWITSNYERENGEMMPISIVLIDSGAFTTRVYECVDRMNLSYVFSSKGVAGNRPVVEHESDRRRRISKSKTKGGHPILVGVDEAKIIVYKRFKIEESGAGFMHTPITRDAEWYNQLTVEQLKIKWNKGFAINTWVKPDGARNEALDCRVYAYAGFKMLKGKYRTLNYTPTYQRRVRAR